VLGNFKYWLSAWAVAFFCALFLELEACFRSSLASHREQVNRLADCKDRAFSLRYPTDCARVTLDPPRYFVFTWVSEAAGRVNVCGPIACSDVMSVRGVLILAALYLIAKTPSVLFKT
jgi:hypothetical protein